MVMAAVWTTSARFVEAPARCRYGDVINPYLSDGRVTVSAHLPCSRDEAWELIGTPDGYTRWFPAGCTGPFEVGAEVEKTWWWSSAERSSHSVVGFEPTRFIEFSWEIVDGAVARYQVEPGEPTVVSIIASYPESPAGRDAQLLDVAPWTFALLNLKSVASGGVDLRQRDQRNPAVGLPFID